MRQLGPLWEWSRDLSPDQVNPVDSLGEVHYFMGRFAEAETYFLDVQKRDPSFLGGIALAKAAQCRLMRGDLAGADELFGKYAAGLARNAPLRPAIQAQWLFLTGRRRAAIAAMEQLSGQNGPVSGYASVQLTVWWLLLGDEQRARSAAARCGPGGGGLLCRGLVDRSAPLPVPTREVADYYSAALGPNSAQALPQMKSRFKKADPNSDAEIRSAYAWALVQADRAAEAVPLVELYPLPVRGGDLLFSCLEFPRFLAARAAVRDKQGKADEAAAARALHEKYAGDIALASR